MKLDIATTVRVLFVFLLFLGILFFIRAWRGFQEAKRLYFFIKRRQLLKQMWVLVLIGSIIIIFAFSVNKFTEPIVYQFFVPSPTMTFTPTNSSTPTITQTPTISPTPTVTFTPQFTSTPVLPVVISEGFKSTVTPNPKAVFSQISFSRKLDKFLRPLYPENSFNNPIITLFGSFSYDQMIIGSQWTALWFRDNELIAYESIPWNGASGGYGFTDSKFSPEEWLPGKYEVQIFVGSSWKTSGSFEVVGIPATSTPTPTNTPTKTVTPTFTPTRTPTQTPTITLTPTLKPTMTSTSTHTPRPVLTPTPD
jgi:hypothetical protein